jgi:hypothetical protein
MECVEAWESKKVVRRDPLNHLLHCYIDGTFKTRNMAGARTFEDYGCVEAQEYMVTVI